VALLVPSEEAILGQLDLFRELAPGQLAHVVALLSAKAVAAGTRFIAPEEPDRLVYVIAGGFAKIHVERMDGSEVILSILGPGEIVGR
jgi:CRP-like cAMP-binding protein